jgi:hypothetical protein
MINKSYAITTSLMRIGLLTAQIAVSPSAATQTMPANAGQQPALMERETDLALSAYPPMVKRKTAVYVVENSGYLKLRGSNNASSGIIQRSLATSGPGGVEESGTTGAAGSFPGGSPFLPTTTCPNLSAKMVWRPSAWQTPSLPQPSWYRAAHSRVRSTIPRQRHA